MVTLRLHCQVRVELQEEKKATSNSNSEHALYQLLGLVRNGDSLCNI